MRIGQRVRVKYIPDNVANDVKLCLNQIGTITVYGSPSKTGERGYYVRFGNGLPKGKRFYENELEVVR